MEIQHTTKGLRNAFGWNAFRPAIAFQTTADAGPTESTCRVGDFALIAADFTASAVR